jgi:ABC-type nitrate/sulfonate/bicarbonate transport system permease component
MSSFEGWTATAEAVPLAGRVLASQLTPPSVVMYRTIAPSAVLPPAKRWLEFREWTAKASIFVVCIKLVQFRPPSTDL